MNKTTYNKLVRDGIPGRLKTEGLNFSVHTASDEEFRAAVYDKIVEEGEELQGASDREERLGELADLREILAVAAEIDGFTDEEIAAAQEAKRAERGGFSARIILESVVEK
jgi:predicted house-cleaning noncanonical NTP pyrophosphatase (MazG superfamily)